jgi:hypothetical protein
VIFCISNVITGNANGGILKRWDLVEGGEVIGGTALRRD